jgi:hypothetical protein
VEIVRTIMRFFSYIFHGLLALLLLGLASLAGFSGDHNLRLDMLPWTGKALTWWLFGLSLFGLVAVVLAVKGILRVLFFVWSAAVLVLMIKGYFLSSYFFRPGEFSTVVYMNAGAALALIGAWFQLRCGQPKKYLKNKAY